MAQPEQLQAISFTRKFTQTRTILNNCQYLCKTNIYPFQLTV